MPGKDQITNKKAMFGNNRSHAMNASRRKFNLNLQKVTIVDNHQKKTLRVSAKTRKTLKKHGKIA